MAAPPSKHWTHPQAIPRGLLRVYILTALARGPTTGYEIMQRIDEKTDGAWRPGPGTIYPLLKAMARDKLVTPSKKTFRTSRVVYTMTPAARRELESMYSGMASYGRKERVIMRLVADMMPNANLVPILLNRSRDGAEFLRERIAELPEEERMSALRELRSMTENQLDWIRASLERSGPMRVKQKRIR
jgi:DNA-binding PadR family transcriptional regulator